MRQALLLVLAIAAFSGGAAAAPEEVSEGDVRLVSAPMGASLRKTPLGEFPIFGSVRYGTSVLVQEVREPWIRIMVIAGPTEPPRWGWLLLDETSPPAPPRGGSIVPQPSPPGDSADRDAHPELASAFDRVDDMVSATRALDPQACIAFVKEGRLGRADQDWERPPLLPPTPQARPQAEPEEGIGRSGDLLGPLARDTRRITRALLKRFTPEQEYTLGRAVAAAGIARHGVEPTEALRTYVRNVGDVLVRKSTRIPPNLGGYHFEVLDSDAVETRSAPGGFVLITRGAVRECRDEDELAGLLAHELAHVTQRHSEATIRRSPFLVARTLTDAVEAAAIDHPRPSAELRELFEANLIEVLLSSTAPESSRELELEADREGTVLLLDVVYDHGALRDVLRRVAVGGPVKAADRLAALGAVIARVGPAHPSVVEARAQRVARFKAAVAVR